MDRDKIMQWTKTRLRESFSRDTLIIQSIQTIDELTSVINKVTVLVRERYGYYAPKLAREEDAALLLKNVLERKKDDLGVEMKQEDIDSLVELAEEVQKLQALQEEQEHYLEKIMEETCPKVKEAATAKIGARLINLAGSLKHLAEIPSSTIQVLGAEKALFRHIRTGAKAPKFGVIFSHPDVTGAEPEERGKKARKLASKISISAKQDYFRE